MNTAIESINPASFRDPDGYVFYADGAIFRRINTSAREDYNLLRSSGLFDRLTESHLLVDHKEVSLDSNVDPTCYRIIEPQLVPFISYPYEWSFSQLKDAALLTLTCQKLALEHGMSLKDASAFNVQFLNGRPIFIDTLSFEAYTDNLPWKAYRQFCQHFLLPLALMAYRDVRFGRELVNYLDGIPLDLGAKLLPFMRSLRPSLFIHIKAHAWMQAKHSDTKASKKVIRPVPKRSLFALIDSLESAVRGIKWAPSRSEWRDYYQDTSYSTEGMEKKRSFVGAFIEQVNPSSVWDIGANTGEFSRVAAAMNIPVISFDIDPSCVELNYLRAKKEKTSNIIPLFLDITNPSPGIGWGHKERASLEDRGPVDLLMALAIIHHLGITNNIPFQKIAAYFSTICRKLIIEFVPKDDPQSQRLLKNREDIFTEYNQKNFEAAFGQYFTVVKTEKVQGSNRVLYLMTKKD